VRKLSRLPLVLEESNPASYSGWTRRQFILGTSGGALLFLTGCGSSGRDAAPGSPESCLETAADIEGPFWRAGSPERTNLDLYGDAGTVLSISGSVRDTDCRPINNATVEVWHGYPTTIPVEELSSDADVQYDNTTEEMRYRGYTVTGADGQFSFRTLKPGWYQALGAYRPAHVHFKVWRDGIELLTTQMYFAGDPFLTSDPWAAADLAVALDVGNDGTEHGVFDLIIGNTR
jgi:catechol 1,2-dioxygenase